MVKLDTYSFIVAKRTNEKYNCWINIYVHSSEKVYVLLHVYNVLHGKQLKPKLFDVLLIKAYSKGEGIFEDQIYNTNSQRASNMLSNVFKCFMLISLPKKHESITY